MKDFIFLFRGGADMSSLSPEQLQQNMLPWSQWMDNLAKAGHLTGGERLNGHGAVLSGKDTQLIDGPYAEGKEVVGGYLSIKANDLQHAIELAKGCPIFANGGTTEIREVAGM